MVYFIKLSNQIQVYQFGVHLSKSIQWEEFLQRRRKRSEVGQPVPSCAGRGWAAATGPGIVGGGGDTPVSQ